LVNIFVYNRNMINIKYLFDDIYMVMMKKQTIFEILLHLTFILIIFLLIVIFYWDTIKRNILKTARCKITMDNSDSQFNVRLFDKNTNSSIININYDNTKKHNYKIDCVCPRGNELNNFKDIPVFNSDTKKVEKVDKICYCDDNYKKNIYDENIGALDNDNILLDGDSFLVNFYGGLLDDIKDIRDIRDRQLTFPS
jgi:hypothetical protein